MSIDNGFDAKLLLIGLKKGDKLLFEQIFKQYWRPLLIYLSKIIKDKEDAEDLLQNIFTNLWEKGKNGEIQNLNSWLYGAARKSALFHLRTKKNHEKLIASILQYIQSENFSLSNEQQGKELKIIIENEIEKLPPKMRAVFRLSRQEQLSYREIAEKLNISDQTVKKQISNALGMLRNSLKQQGLYSLLLLLLIDLK